MFSIDSGLWCWDATTQAASDDASSQRRGWRGVLSFSFEVRMRQGRVTLPCKSLRGVHASNNHGKHFIWVHSECKPLRKKGRGQGLHISDFLTPIGCLRDGEACVTLKCGGDAWWTGDRLLDQVINNAIPAFEAQFPRCKALFAFDN